MIPYALLYSSFVFSFSLMEYASGAKKPKASKIYLTLLPIYIFSILYAGYIGTDAKNYNFLYLNAYENWLEPGYSFLMILSQELGLSFRAFSVTISIFQLILLSLIVNRLKDPLIFIFLYFSMFYLNFHFNALRNSVSLLILGVLYVRFGKSGFISLILSILFHYSAIFAVFLQKISLFRRTLVSTFIILILFAAFSLAWLYPAMLDAILPKNLFYRAYLDLVYPSKNFYPSLLIKLVIVFILLKNYGNRILSISFALLTFAVHAYSPILSRLGDIVLFLIILDACYKFHITRFRRTVILTTYIVMLSSFLIPLNDCKSKGIGNWCIPSTDSAWKTLQ